MAQQKIGGAAAQSLANQIDADILATASGVLDAHNVPMQNRHIYTTDSVGIPGGNQYIPQTKTPDDEVAEAMVMIADIDALTEALDRLYKNDQLLHRLVGYEDPVGSSNAGSVLLQIQGALHVARVQTIGALSPLATEEFKK